jgi:hypothetical protein
VILTYDFFDWQFIAAPVFLCLTLLLIATQPLNPPPLWRSIVTILSALTIVFASLIAELTPQFMPYTRVWQSRPISHAPSPYLHYSILAVVLTTSLTLAFTGALACRSNLENRIGA